MRENVDELTIPLEDGRVALAADLMYPSQPVGPHPVLTEALVLFLSSSGHLESSPGDVGTEVVFQSGELTGRTTGLLDPLGTGLGLPEDQHDDDMASLTFETEGLTADLALAGRPHLDLTVPVVPPMDLRLVARVLSDVRFVIELADGPKVDAASSRLSARGRPGPRLRSP